MEILFGGEFPDFGPNNQDDIEFKETWKNKLQKIYWGINLMQEADKKDENGKN